MKIKCTRQPCLLLIILFTAVNICAYLQPSFAKVVQDASYLAALQDSVKKAKETANEAQLRYQSKKKEVQSNCFRIMGKINETELGMVSIWGIAEPLDHDYSKVGTRLQESNIIVINPIKKYIIPNWYNNYYNGGEPHKYLYKEYGKNAFNADVPIYVYGDPDEMPKDVTRQRDRARDRWVRISKRLLDVSYGLIQDSLSYDNNSGAKEIFLQAIKDVPEDSSKKWQEKVRAVMKISDEEISLDRTYEDLIRNYSRSEQPDIAESYFYKLRNYDPNNVAMKQIIIKAYERSAKFNLSDDQLDLAESYLNKIMNYDPENTEMKLLLEQTRKLISERFVRLARYQLELGNFDSTEALLNSALRYDYYSQTQEIAELFEAAKKGKTEKLILNAESLINENRFIESQNTLDSAYTIDSTNNKIINLRERISKHRKSPTLAATLSIMPGGGQIYNGKTGRAALFFFSEAFFLGYCLVPESNGNFSDKPGAALWFSLIYVINIFDAYQSAKNYNSKHFLSQNTHQLLIYPKVDGNTPIICISFSP